jgi:sensor histidine kinase YesM
MDTTLADRRITWPLIILYGIIAALPGILGNLIYVYLIGEPMSDTYEMGFNQEYMTRIGIFIFMTLGFLSYAGIIFWITKPDRARSLYNGFRLVFVGYAVELLFLWIVGIQYRIAFAFTLAVYFVAILIATFTPLMLKGRRKHLKDWDAKKGPEYDKKTRK